MTREEAKVKEHFKKYYNKDIDELTIASAKGYWKDYDTTTAIYSRRT